MKATPTATPTPSIWDKISNQHRLDIEKIKVKREKRLDFLDTASDDELKQYHEAIANSPADDLKIINKIKNKK